MANVKITQLPLATTPLTGTEVFPLVQGTTTKQVSITGLFTSPVMTNPTLGTVGQADLINATGLPISTGVAGLGTGIATFLGTPSSANLRAAVTDETGTGSLVFANSPTLITPNLGTPSAMVATNITGTALGLIAGSAVTNANLTGAVTSIGNATSLGSFTSAQLRTALTDETGSGVAVFATSPTLVTPDLGTPSAGVLTNATGLPLTTGVTGTLGLGNGGTGQTTANAAFNALAPSQTGNSGKYLTTDGTNTSWATNPLGTVTSVGGTGTVSGITLSGTVTTSGNLTLGGALDLSAYNGAGAFTTLSASSTVTLSGGTANGVTYLNGSKVLTSGSALTFDGTNLALTTTNAIYKVPTAGGSLFDAGGNNGIYILGSSNYVATYVAGSEQMRLTSTGLGIGTSSPSQKLHVRQDQAAYTWGRFDNQSSSASAYAGIQVAAFGNTWGIAIGSSAANSNALTFVLDAGGANSEKMRLDSAGNLGLGVTPSAWGSTYRAMQIGIGTSLTGVTNDVDVSLSNNARFDGTDWRYLASSPAERYRLVAGSHRWYTAASGTAGNAITFTQAMTLDASGNLGVGTTAIRAKFVVNEYTNTSYTELVAFTGAKGSFVGIPTNQLAIVDSTAQAAGVGGEISFEGKYDASNTTCFASVGGVKENSTSSDYGGAFVVRTRVNGGNLTERARIDSSGTFILKSGAAGNQLQFWDTGAVAERARIGITSNNLSFACGGTSANMTLDSSGRLLVGTTSAITIDGTTVDHAFRGTTGNNAFAVGIQNTGNSTPLGLAIKYTAAAPNGTGSQFLYCSDNLGVNRAEIRSNGGLANYSANNVNLSDRREKTNFAPAGEYLSKICAIPVQTFNYIDQNLEEDDGLTLGVVAQDVQAVAPELVMESNWGTEENPKMRLSIYQTDLQYALMKCIQEQQAIIESLKARLDAANL